MSPPPARLAFEGGLPSEGGVTSLASDMTGYVKIEKISFRRYTAQYVAMQSGYDMTMKIRGRRLWATFRRRFDVLFRPVRLRDILAVMGRAVIRVGSAVMYLPTVAVRKFLQLFISSVGSTRFAMHLFVLTIGVIISVSGLLKNGTIGVASGQESRYVVAFGSTMESNDFASFIEGGYLIKSNIPVTTTPLRGLVGAQEYIVQPGDTLSVIAANFGVSMKTIEWANQIADIKKLRPGQKLTILPASGIAYTVTEGETINSIAENFGISAGDLIAQNDLVAPVRLSIDQQLVVPVTDSQIPNMPKPEPKVIAKSSGSGSSSSSRSSASVPVGSVVGSGQFVWPTSGKITNNCAQHGARDCAIDINNRSYPPVVAADDGVVVVAGWVDNYGYGNRVEIDHGNGYKTRYAHLNEIYVEVGQEVSQGQIIGQLGSTGRSTGPHLHFMIIENGTPRDPLLFL